MPMDVVFLLARLALAVVLATSGIAKLFDRAGSRSAYEAFRLPARYREPVSRLLPIAEIALALALLPARLVPVSATLATGLFLAFTLMVGRSVARGDAVECHCFGQLSAAPATWWTVGRNVALTAIAAAVSAHGMRSAALPPFGHLSLEHALIVTGFILCAGAIAALASLVMQLWAQQGRLLLQIDALSASETETATLIPFPSPLAATARPLPSLALTTLDAQDVELSGLARSKPLLVVFSDPTCGPCTALLPELRQWQERYAAAFTLAVVSQGDAAAVRAKAADHGLANVLLQQGKTASAALGIQGTPSAVVIDRHGQIRGEAARGASAIRDVVAALARTAPVVADARSQAPSRVGQLVPLKPVPGLDGQKMFVGGPSDRGQALVFWNPGCGFCRRMLADLKRLEASWPASAPELVVVSTGAPEANREQGLTSLVVLDEGFAIGRFVGATGTPSAVVIDRRGRIASEVHVGAPSILELFDSLTELAS